ncbi:LuxR C-terminal-related transcriptional regulator [Catenuloplanes sp. NPDC051500]|uniref:LuxR C-terminal-related transcriptional regulator n=1 Tax=Catenuloplanes sp. NPDC051500 TaxID=3363959 RepID=UPI0037BA47BB
MSVAQERVVPCLGRWGLSAHADLVYRGLVLQGPDTTRSLAGHLGVEARQVDRALDELVGVGAVRVRTDGRTRYWHPVAGDVVVSMLHRQRVPDVRDVRLRRHLAAVAGLHLDRLPAESVSRLPSREAARDRIAGLVAAERCEHLTINTEYEFSAAASAAASPLDRSLLARGVRLRTLTPPPPSGDHAEPLAAGAEHRERSVLPLKLMVFDQRAALFPADPADREAGAVLLTDPDAVAQLTRLFYRFWGDARDIYQHKAPTIMLSTREQAIIALLSAGHSEAAIAAELGLSRRTVVYTLRALMDRLGVQNRFQLALLLGAARAVPIPEAPPPSPWQPEES